MPTASSKSTQGPEAAAGRAGARLPRLFPCELFLLTAQSRDALVALVAEVLGHLGRPGPAALADLAFTLSRSYRPDLECLAIVASSHEDLQAKLVRAREELQERDRDRIHHRDGAYYYRERLGAQKVAFLFPGENAQYANMLAELCLHFPEVREAFDETDAACLAAGDGFRPSALNFPPPGEAGTSDGDGGDEISEWEKAVVLVHTANAAFTRLLRGLRMRPDAVLGHSFGEASALEMAGVLRPGLGADRIAFGQAAYLHLRELARERDLPRGRLLAVGGAERTRIDALLARHPGALALAMVNCPHQYVLCASGPGTDAALDEAERALIADGAVCVRLPIQRPYHTPFFEPAFPLEKAYYEKVGVHPPQIEVYSCSTTEPFPADPQAIVEVAARHWMSCVRFQDTIEKMYARGFRVFVDVGPRGNLCAFVGDTLGGRPHLTVALNRPKRPETEQLLNALALLAAHGVPLDVAYLHERWGSRVVDLRAAAGGRSRSMELQLPIHLPPMTADGVVIRRPAPAVRASAPEPALEPSVRALPGHAVPVAARASEVDGVMGSYMDTMERFLSAQGEILGSLMRASAAAERAAPVARESASRRFPLLGTIEESVPAQSLTARRVFDVREDLYLDDHALGVRVSTTDPALHALPVMPLLFSVEMAAEAAVALFPELRVIALVDTRAHRWIFFDRGSVALRAVARRLDDAGDAVRVRVAIQELGEDATAPIHTMVEATVVLGRDYPPPPRSAVASLPESATCDWAFADVYPRRTFHGPLFQGIRGITRRSEEGVDGTVAALPVSGLIRGRPDVQLETDPLLADCLGQAAWLWGSPEPFMGVAYLPYAAEALRFYGPPPPPGSQLQLRLRVRKRDAAGVVMDIEGVDAQGNVRLAMEGLSDREFPITPALHRLILEPAQHDFSAVQSFDLPVEGAGAKRIVLSSVAGFPHDVLEGSLGVWRKALAFLILSPPEREEWLGREVPRRQEILWLLGRAAAKDALRHLIREGADRRFAPADLVIRNDEAGRPLVSGAWHAELPGRPQISISHTDGMAVAVAADGRDGTRLGVDAEVIRAPSQDLLDAAFSEAELGLLPASAREPGAARDEWLFRLWCAKEAVGKALGTGLPLEPRLIAVTRLDAATGVVSVRPEASAEVTATTFRRGRHALAVAVLPPQGRG